MTAKGLPSIPPSSLAPVNPCSAFCHYRLILTVPEFHINECMVVCILLCTATFIWHAFEIQLIVSYILRIYFYLFLNNNISLRGHTTICLTIHLWISTWVVFHFGVIMTKTTNHSCH